MTVRLLTNPTAWQMLVWLLLITSIVGSLATRGDALWPVIPFLGFFLALFIEYWVDPQRFWERHDGDWGE